MNLEQLIKNNQGTVVDVRTPAEFRGGNITGSINIPVSEILQRIEEVKNLEMPIIVCCASGGRSAMATHYLKEQEITCIDAGSWISINQIQSRLENAL